MLRAQQYLFDIGPGQYLSVSLAGEQTVLTTHSDALGQQQSQRSSFPSGAWLIEPQAWFAQGVVYLRIQAQQGTLWLQAARGQMGVGSPPPQTAQPLPGRAMAAAPSPPIQPLPPMEMRMGNMSMGMHPPGPAGDLQAENLRLREENLRLREEVLSLREQLWGQQRAH